MVATKETPPPRGFPKWAWWTVFLATFMFAVPLTSPWWSRVFRAEISGSADDEAEAPGESGKPPAGAEETPSSTFKVTLRMRLEGRPGLSPVEREVPYLRGVVPQIHAAVSQLAIAGDGASALLPEGTRVLDVAFSHGGMAYVDFSPELDSGRSLGAREETLLIQGIVTTITENFGAVRRVVILVDGKAPRLFHLDLTRPLRADDPTFASDETPGPEASPPGPPSSPLPAKL